MKAWEFPEKVNSGSHLTPKTIRLDSLCNVIQAGNSLDLWHNPRRLYEIFDRTLWSTITRESQWSIRGRLCHTVLWNSNRIENHDYYKGWLCGFSLVRYWETLLSLLFSFFYGIVSFVIYSVLQRDKKRTFRSLLKIDRLSNWTIFEIKFFYTIFQKDNIIWYNRICNILWFLYFRHLNCHRIVWKKGFTKRPATNEMFRKSDTIRRIP